MAMKSPWDFFLLLATILTLSGTELAFGAPGSQPSGSPRPVIVEERGMDAGERPNTPPVRMIGPGEFEIGGVRILKKKERVEFPAAINMDEGLLEYLIVGASGKLHESLLRTEVKPYSVHIALLLLGLEGTTNPLGYQGEPREPEGDPVDIRVKWHDKGTLKEGPIEDWVLQGERPMGKTHWVFTGSFVSEGVFMAEVEKSIVAIFHDPVALIDNPMPEGRSDEVWFVRKGAVPPPGTEVTVIIEKRSKTGS
ncbi:MAG: YdjY domain-containing protein [Thermodesulfobacteriota bacterium]|nr:YdjY domain-containing protein [Thermodesulfobacteriota bacterium]